jgi:hypothetical protein
MEVQMSRFFRMLTIQAAETARYPDAIRRMRRGEFEGILLRGVYEDADCARLATRLEAGRHDLVRSDFPPVMRAFFLGHNLNLTHPDLVDYFARAPAFREGLTRLFADMYDLETRVTTILSTIDDGLPYRAAPGPEPSLDHMFTTIRAHVPGGFIPPHFDNEQAFRDSYRLVNARIGSDLYSFVLAFTRADAGGALEIFDMLHDGRPWRMADGENDAGRLNLDHVERVSIRLAPGDMILFNSGRYLHRVTPVEGPATRWTACSFMAENLAGDAVHCWG